jgi:lipopolysaccharide transport system permease protein
LCLDYFLDMTTEINTLNPEQESWDLVIQPQRSLLDLRLAELWKYRDLVMLFVRRKVTH